MTSNHDFDSNTLGSKVVETFTVSVVDRTSVITGASVGTIGGQTAIDLAAGRPRQLILAEEVIKVSPTTKAEFVELNLPDFESVRKATDVIANLARDGVDVLINNAGIMALAEYNPSPDGIEMQFATNHLGHFLLTNLLLPCIRPNGRIVNLTSNAFGLAPASIDNPNWDGGKTYHPWLAYGSSKTANLLFTYQLASSTKLVDRGICSYAVHPGLILESHLQDHFDEDTFKLGMETYVKVHADRQKPILAMDGPKILGAGSSTTLVAALDPRLSRLNGRLLDNCQVRELATIEPYAIDGEQARRLWTVSEVMVGQKFNL